MSSRTEGEPAMWPEVQRISKCGCARGHTGSERGAASVEAVIVLPVFILLFVGVLYFAELVEAKADANEEARRCAWAYSMANCGEVPAGCEKPDDAPSTGSNTFASAFEKGTTSAPEGHSLSDLVEPIVQSVVGQAINEAVQGSRLAHASQTLKRPPLFGGKTATPAAEYRLACNLTPQTESNIGEKAWHIFRP